MPPPALLLGQLAEAVLLDGYNRTRPPHGVFHAQQSVEVHY
jgi:hypothetical protein